MSSRSFLRFECRRLTLPPLTASSDDNYKPPSTSTIATSSATSIDGSEQSKTSHEDAEQARATGKEIAKGKEPKVDLGLLYTHRLSHVAETGQLIPRSKRSPRISGDCSRTTTTRAPRPRHPPISMHNRRVSRSLPTTPTDDVQVPFDFAASNHNVSLRTQQTKIPRVRSRRHPLAILQLIPSKKRISLM